MVYHVPNFFHIVRLFYLKIWQSNLAIGEYDGVPAVLSEQALESDKLVLDVVKDLTCTSGQGSSENDQIWILGASYDSITNIESNNAVMCGEESCFDKSLIERKICKPGPLIFLIFLWIFEN